MMNACVLMELSVGITERTSAMTSNRAFELELIDAEGIDSTSLLTVNAAEDKVELIFQWIQQLI
eukprot:CAMPEP_0197931982 /NCGR_PEP_ID=MMETSP1439-20131203/107925_1 /TAXON_ID=66791 /ORGANISM="Gonyaulax spinifera, Strain CCMP409" /LENGTH=63 /DNA_ID=CAMNT_0043554743 /DNA_START=47 /DNA_END=235 /DNA_ORIENTATION=-